MNNSDLRTPLRIAAIRGAFGVFGAGCGWLAGLVMAAVWSPQDHTGLAHSIALWGALTGGVLGAVSGERELSGRTTWIAWGLVIGVACGALSGWIWAHFEYDRLAERLAASGIRLPVVKASPSVGDYEEIGLHYGIPLGALAGLATALLWNRSRRQLIVGAVATICLLGIGIFWMNSAFQRTSESAARYWQKRMARFRQSAPWRRLKPTLQERTSDGRFDAALSIAIESPQANASGKRSGVLKFGPSHEAVAPILVLCVSGPADRHGRGAPLRIAGLQAAGGNPAD